MFITALATTLAISASSASDCLENLTAQLCLVDPPVTEADRYRDDRPCLNADLTGYAEMIRSVFPTYPKAIQQRFCAVRKLYIEKQFFGPAWSSAVDGSKPLAFLIGLRQADLDAALNLQDYLSWFEQQTFGGDPNFKVVAGLPTVEIQPAAAAHMSYVFFTVLHEIGHTCDYEYGYNPGTWTKLSWLDLNTIQPRFDFPERTSICLNNCEGKYLDPKAASELYQGILSHGFVSQLSAMNAMEDFAESLSFYVFVKEVGAEVTVVSPDGTRFSVGDALSSDSFAAKRDYLTNEASSCHGNGPFRNPSL